MTRPRFTAGANQTVNEDAGAQLVSPWATGVSAGPNEAGQTLTFTATATTNPALFSAQPFVAPNGALTYTPAPNANGSSTVLVSLSDSGGLANGGANTSAPQSFTITVNAVNDAPVATGQGVSTTEDTDSAAITLAATDIDSAALTYSIVTGPSHGTLIGAAPNVIYRPGTELQRHRQLHVQGERRQPRFEHRHGHRHRDAGQRSAGRQRRRGHDQ